MRAFVGENYVKQIAGHTTQTLRRRKLLIILEYIFLSHFRAFYNCHFRTYNYRDSLKVFEKLIIYFVKNIRIDRHFTTCKYQKIYPIYCLNMIHLSSQLPHSNAHTFDD